MQTIDLRDFNEKLCITIGKYTYIINGADIKRYNNNVEGERVVLDWVNKEVKDSYEKIKMPL